MKFEVGKKYYPAASGVNPIRIVSRTEKMATVDNGYCKWRMRIRIGKDDNEWMCDSTAPRCWRFQMVYCAKWEAQDC